MFNKSFIFIFSLILISSLAYADVCINPIQDVFSGEESCTNGYQTDHPRNCSFTIDPTVSSTGFVVIEVISGGRYGSARNMYLNYSDTNTLNIYLDRETSPIYLTCHSSENTNSTEGSVGWIKNEILQQYLLFSDDTNYTSIDPEDSLVIEIGNLSNSINNLPNTFDEFKINSYYVNINSTDNDIIKYMAWIFLGIGLILLMNLLFIRNEK